MRRSMTALQQKVDDFKNSNEKQYERYFDLLETIESGVFETDTQGKVIFCSSSFTKLMQRPANELINHCFWQFETDFVKIQNYFDFVNKNHPIPIPFITSTIMPNNEVHNFKIDWNYLYEANKVEGYIAIATDITDLFKIQLTLMNEKELLQTLIDNIPYTVYFKDANCQFTRINQEQARMIGVNSPEDAIGKSDFDYFPHAQSAYEDEQRILRTGVPLIDKEEKIRRADGVERWVSTTKIPIHDKNANIIGLVGITRDITEWRNTEEKLKEAKNKAERSDRLKSAFLANMSHEIRTPMNAIIGFTEMLADKSISGNERDIYVSYIKNSSNTLLNLIDDIIDIAKIEAGELKIKKEEFSVRKILDELLISYERQRLKTGKTKLKFAIQDDLENEDVIIFSDPFRFRQILSNLLNNALKFTDEGQITMGYHVKSGQMLEFFVRDSGIGMPAEKLDIIFERFGQIDDIYNKNKRGTGLGLAISKNLVKILGGEMKVESEIQKGSVFYFTLPYKSRVSSKREVEPQKSSGERNLQWPGKTILVAEDVVINFKLIEIALRKSELTILWAKDGAEAIRIVESNPKIDLILMDIQMPVMDGYTATKIIKSQNPNIPIIAQTAFAMSGEKENSQNAGCDDYLTKPIKTSALFAILDKYLKSLLTE